MYNPLDRIPACVRRTDWQTDGQTDGQTSCHGIVRAMHPRRAVKIVRLAVCTVCQYRCLVNYAVAQLQRKRTLLYWSNIPYIPARPMSNFSFLVRHLFQFLFWPHRRDCHVSMPHCTNIGSLAEEIWRLIDFKMAVAVAQFYIGLGDVSFFIPSMSISPPNIVRITQSTAEI